MIRLRHDCLEFKDAGGETVPCSAHELTVQLVGQTAGWIDAEMIQHAALAVVHYFKTEKGLSSISVAEFAAALGRVLKGLGLSVEALATVTSASPPPEMPEPAETPESPGGPARIVEADLRELAGGSASCCELLFFPALRKAVCSRLDGTPVVLRFGGLRACVKQLAGAHRWTADCQRLREQIVEYLRSCLASAEHGRGCLLVVL